ncbi:MAG TPA: alpha/beta fold hydrolase [Acidobacteriota bacterium]|nr:alpha/beta fold hydrolase [Acidobacteriota bacterium]
MFDLLKLSEMLSQISQPPEVAKTPSKVVYRENKLRVLYYLPKVKKTHSVPILIVNSLINKYYILDLMPGKSYVEYLANQGFRVYMIDWGEPDDHDSHLTLEDHINKYLVNITRAVLTHAGAEQVSMIGYCMGGTMALMYAALHKQFLKNLILLATPVDFHNDSLLSTWAQPEYFNVDQFIDRHGNAPVEILKSTFMMLKPTKNVTKYVHLAENLHNEEYVKMFQAFDYWVNDAVAVPGETFRKFIKDTYQQNLLRQNKMKLGRKLIKLKNVTCPLLNVVAEHDDIVPLSSSTVVMDLVGSQEKEEIRVKGGHHGISVGPGAIKLVWPKTVEWLANRE